MGDAPTAGTEVFRDNAALTQVVRQPSATGWAGSWSGVTVVISP